MTCQEWLTREQTARKRDERNDRDMQDAGRRSEEENAAANSRQRVQCFQRPPSLNYH